MNYNQCTPHEHNNLPFQPSNSELKYFHKSRLKGVYPHVLGDPAHFSEHDYHNSNCVMHAVKHDLINNQLILQQTFADLSQVDFNFYADYGYIGLPIADATDVTIYLSNQVALANSVNIIDNIMGIYNFDYQITATDLGGNAKIHHLFYKDNDQPLLLNFKNVELAKTIEVHTFMNQNQLAKSNSYCERYTFASADIGNDFLLKFETSKRPIAIAIKTDLNNPAIHIYNDVYGTVDLINYV